MTYNWEQCKLGDLCTLNKGEQINKNQLFDFGEYYVLNGGITPSGYTSKFNTDENTISISEGGNSCGFVNYNSRKFWSGGHNYTLNALKYVEVQFLYQYLKNKEQDIMELRVGSGLPNIQRKALLEFMVFYPSAKEQTKIGALFSKLDNLITLHQRGVKYIRRKT